MPGVYSNKSRFVRTGSVLAITGILVSSCATPISQVARIGTDTGKDPCRSQVVALDSTGDFFAEDILKGVVIGALTGAAIGAVAAGASGQNPMQGALIGGVGGLVAGGIGGYWMHRQQQGLDQALIGMRQDLQNEMSSIEKADMAIKALTACRIQQRDKIKSDFKNNLISKEEAEQSWNELKALIQKDNELIDMVAKNLNKRRDEFTYAYDQMNKEDDLSKLSKEEIKELKRKANEKKKEIDKKYRENVRSIKQRTAEEKKAAGKDKKLKAEIAEKEKEEIANEKRARDDTNALLAKAPTKAESASYYYDLSTNKDKLGNSYSGFESAKTASQNVIGPTSGFEGWLKNEHWYPLHWTFSAAKSCLSVSFAIPGQNGLRFSSLMDWQGDLTINTREV